MNLTAWILVVIVALLISWDIYAVVRWGVSATISYDLNQACHAQPILAAVLGALLYHFCK